MAPRKAVPKPAVKKGPVKLPDKGTQEKKQRQADAKARKLKNPLGLASPATCKTCNQNTHQYDRDAPSDAPFFVKWARVTDRLIGKVMVPHPDFEECYTCFQVRREVETPDGKLLTQKALIEMCSNNDQLAEDICVRRKAKACKSNEFRGRHLNVAAYTSKVSQEGKDDFIEGTFTPLWDFNEERRLGFVKGDHTDQELEDFILQKFPHVRCEYDLDGVYGVALDDHTGGKHRYRKRKSEFRELRREQRHEDKSEASEAFKNDCGRLAQKPRATCAEPTPDRDRYDAGIESDGDQASGAETNVESIPSTKLYFNPAVQATRPPSVRPSTSSHRSRFKTPRPQRRGVPSIASSYAPSLPPSEPASEAVPGEDDGEPAKKKRRTAAESALEKASAKLDAVSEKYKFEGHFGMKTRKREYDLAVGSVQSHARKVSAITGNEDAQKLGINLFALADRMDAQQEFFDEFRNKFVSLVLRALTEKEGKMLHDAPREFLAMLVVAELEKLTFTAPSHDMSMKAFLSCSLYSLLPSIVRCKLSSLVTCTVQFACKTTKMGNKCGGEGAVVQEVEQEQAILVQEAERGAVVQDVEQGQAILAQEAQGGAVVQDAKIEEEANAGKAEETTDGAQSRPEEVNAPMEAAPEKAKDAANVQAEEMMAATEVKIDKQDQKLVIVFEIKGGEKSVEFTRKELGFECTQRACCAPGKAGPVRVTKVVANQQAAALGVPRGAKILRINGKDIADAIQYRDLLADALLVFSDVVLTLAPESDPKAEIEGTPIAGTAFADSEPAPVPAVSPGETVAPAVEPKETGDAMAAPAPQAAPAAAQEAGSICA